MKTNMIVIGAIILVLLTLGLAIIASGKQNRQPRETSLDSDTTWKIMDGKTEMPQDVQRRLERDFPDGAIRSEASRVLMTAYEASGNVGAKQFVRAILVLAKGDLEALKNFASPDDPRDVVMWADREADYKSESLTVPFPE